MAEADVLTNLTKSVELLTQLVSTQKAAGTTLTPYAAVHGPGGIFSNPNQRAQVVNAMAMPRSLWSYLPARTSNETNPLFPILTGVTASTGEQPDGYCDDCKTAGNLKACNQMYPFGRLCLDSTPIQLDALGLVTGRGEMRDQVLIGNPFEQGGAVPALSRNEILRNNFQAKRASLWASWWLDYAAVAFTGTPANNSGGYAEFYGLDTLVNDGKVDAVTGVACPAADSLVIDFGDVQIDAEAAAFVTQMVDLYRAQKYLASQVGMPDMTFAWVMRYGAFMKVTEVWACTYLTFRCAVPSTGATVNIDGTAAAALLNEMRSGQFLMIDGERVPVLIDDAITETIPDNGVAESSIYLIPLRSSLWTHTGGAVSYWEFQDMREALADIAPLRATSSFFQALNGGTHLFYEKAPSNLCIQFGLLAKPRLIIEAPFLAGRIDGVRYQFINHERSPFPGAAYYHVNGGSYYAPDQYFYPIPA
jgi:hypothetical protein